MIFDGRSWMESASNDTHKQLLSTMNIRFLETVIRLAELRNFRLTAERMNITPAAISNRISAIEQELGTRLFNRDGRDVTLTTEGAYFVDAAREIVQLYDRLANDLRPSNAVEGSIRVGVLPAIAMTILPPILDILRTQFPRIRLSVRTNSSRELLRCLDQGEIDIAVSISRGMPGTNLDQYQRVELYSLGMFWIASKDFPIEDTPINAEDLLPHPIISYEIGTTNYNRMTKYMPYGSLQEAILHYSNSLATTISMVSSGIGISVLPAAVIDKEIKAGTLRVLDVRPAFPPTDYAAFYLENPGSRLAPLVASIAANVAKTFCTGHPPTIAKPL
jgi:DNA-binding transcriptional LysR family regulator